MEAMTSWRLLLLTVGCVMSAGQAVSVQKEDLVAHYEQYNGVSIIVRGEVVSGPEMTIMYLSSSPKEMGAKEGMLITLSETISKRPGKLEKRFIKALKKTGRVDAELEGHFEGAADRRWGHQTCCRFRLQIEHVIALK